MKVVIYELDASLERRFVVTFDEILTCCDINRKGAIVTPAFKIMYKIFTSLEGVIFLISAKKINFSFPRPGSLALDLTM